MDELLKKLSETSGSGWTVFPEEGGNDGGKAMLLDDTAATDPQAETENTIAAISELPDCAVLVITKEGNLAALNAAMEVYASVKHFGHKASFLLLRDQNAAPEALGEKCREIVMKWQKDLPRQ